MKDMYVVMVCVPAEPMWLQRRMYSTVASHEGPASERGKPERSS
jgi:hypothetical protein